MNRNKHDSLTLLAFTQKTQPMQQAPYGMRLYRPAVSGILMHTAYLKYQSDAKWSALAGDTLE